MERTLGPDPIRPNRRVELFHTLAFLRAQKLRAERLGGFYLESYTQMDRQHLEKVERLYRIHCSMIPHSTGSKPQQR